MEPCNTGKDYFTPLQREHLEAFLSVEPVVQYAYTNKAGETRSVFRVYLPKGIITKETSFRGFVPNTEYRYYETPRDSITAHKEAEVVYRDAKGELVTCKSSEWLAFLGEDWTAVREPDTVPPTVVPLEMIKAMKAGKTNFAEQDKKEKEASEVWVSPTKREKRLKSS